VLGSRGPAVTRCSAGNDSDHFVFSDELAGQSGCLFGAAVVVVNDHIDLAAVDTASFIDLDDAMSTPFIADCPKLKVGPLRSPK